MTDDREALGRLVHETRLAHEADQAAADGRKRFNLGAWEERAPSQRELDMRIGAAVAARAVADAGIDPAALQVARRDLRRIAALCRDEPSGSIATGLILAIIDSEEESRGER